MQWDDVTDRVRVDRWLWAARFFKTRSLAADAVAAGKVEINGERAKPAKGVKVGDTLRIRLTPYDYVVEARGLAERRGTASAAQELYEETEASRAARERLATQLKMAPAPFNYEEKGRPTKKDRREISRLIDRSRDG
jgi:ribosome-associated heat shock protein Hsp15